MWLHRTNNLEDLYHDASHYSGIEVDVVYYNDLEALEVNHPPQERTHLFIDDYLLLLSEGNYNTIWFDLKNLDDKNVERISLFLASMCEEYQVERQQIIVESPRVDLLQYFSNKNFKTSYYLPYDWYTKSKEEQDLILQSIELTHEMYSTDYMSLDYHEYPMIRDYFPEDTLLVWHTLYGDLNKLKARYLLFKILNDKKVEAVLVSK